MKNIATFFLTSVLLFSVVAGISGQDAVPPFRRAQPSPSPEESTTTPTPKPRPIATATPTPKPRPIATPSPDSTPEIQATPAPSAQAKKPEKTPKPSPARAEVSKPKRSVLKEEPVRAVEPRQPLIRRIPAQKLDGPAAYKPTFDLSHSSSWATNATIRSMENKWQDAVKAHDVDALEKLLDDDFVAKSASGGRASKQRLLRELRNDKNVYKSVHVRGTSVRMIREGVAVITGVATESGTKEDGQPFTSSRRFSDTWKEREGQWVCTASEVTEIPKP